MSPGDLVACINVSHLPQCTNTNLQYLTLGQVYTVRGIQDYPHTSGVYLEEIRNEPDALYAQEIAYDLRRFRVLTKKPDIGIFNRIADKPRIRKPELV